MKTKNIVIGGLGLLLSHTHLHANELTNPGFEANPPTTGWGNHIGHSILPWVLGTGNSSNVIRTDGGQSATFGNQGPIFDASGSPAGTVRHYLDIAQGSNDFYQSFTSGITGTVTFGGYFSTRQNFQGTARVTLRKDVGTAGQILGQSNQVTLPGGDSKNDPWTLVSYTAEVVSGQTYSLVIQMDNNMNFDEGFVRLKGDQPDVKPGDLVGSLDSTLGDSLAVDINILATLKPKTNPCCPPINKDVIMKQLTPMFQPNGGSNSNYRMNFSATQEFNNQMLHYVDYVNSMQPQINAIITNWRVFEKEPGGPGSPLPTSPGLGTVVEEFFTTFSTNQPHTNHGNTSQSFKMKPNHWYRIQTGTYFNGDLKFFESKCAVSSYWVNYMVMQNKSGKVPESKFVVFDEKRVGRTFDVKRSNPGKPSRAQSDKKAPQDLKKRKINPALKRLRQR